ncbi:hypothetical protein [Actinoplanes sp. NBRC 101535]|uniref:hypothetical protein n=1 Tax=Actinoplanes sp. NBRC 101535 TaxID=3032196 RepID=UPI0024A60A21|nr:hypothetical protein [Actinoplanes sp. NBRC 101535]GLY08219.1 hypothetical protein Acsp01_85980 [Actinoplanes sp. NBRC 101535]
MAVRTVGERSVPVPELRRRLQVAAVRSRAQVLRAAVGAGPGVPADDWTGTGAVLDMRRAGVVNPGLMLPVGTRVMGLPWPAGVVAECRDTALGGVRQSFWVAVPGGKREAVHVGTLSRVLLRVGWWWECRWCGLGAPGAVSQAAQAAELAGHEAVCPYGARG